MADGSSQDSRASQPLSLDCATPREEKGLVLLPSGVSVASEARPIIAFYSRFRDICIYIYIYIYIYIMYIYMSVCKCIVQDRAHLTQVL